ncbi:MAG: macro domain-containing protein [Parasporobacterium sp.]|nr:macro domain-containing protein [Parasporobacterium sp.]
MSFRIVRNDITKMNTEAIVNTANEQPVVGTGCDSAVYKAAGYDALLSYRKEKIGIVQEGEVFITPGFDLPAKYIIHAVSPLYLGGSEGEEIKLRSCYRKSLELAGENGIRSVAFPLISTGGFGYPKEEGIRIAADEINAFLLNHEMEIFLVVFDDKAKSLGERIYPDLEEYIDQNYVEEKREEEYGGGWKSQYSAGFNASAEASVDFRETSEYPTDINERRDIRGRQGVEGTRRDKRTDFRTDALQAPAPIGSVKPPALAKESKETRLRSIFKKGSRKAPSMVSEDEYLDFEEEHESRLEERIKHLSDTFSEYLLYLIQNKNMQNAEVYKRAIVDKKTFSKIKNNADYHPQKLTALCLCVGAKLNLDESKDLLARAGYALSPCDKTDIIFSYFIENEIYDMIELDIQLEEHGLPCIIS